MGCAKDTPKAGEFHGGGVEDVGGRWSSEVEFREDVG